MAELAAHWGFARPIPLALAEGVAGRLHRVEPDINSGCWLWSGKVNGGGYAVIVVKSKPYLAHRIAFVLHSAADLAADILIRHKCDTPPCVNPLHLEPGDYIQNTQDMVARGRVHRWLGKRSGENNLHSKLTEEQVRDIREADRNGVPIATLAMKHGVSARTISAVRPRTTWRHVD